MLDIKKIINKNYSSVVYTVKQAYRCDKVLLPLMCMNMLMDSIVPFISVVFPKYIIDELTIGKDLKNAVTWVLLFISCSLIVKSINTALDGVVNCKKEKLIQQHYKVFSNKTMSMDLEDIENSEILDQKIRAQQVITWNNRNIDGVKNAIGGMISYSLQIAGYVYILSKLNVVIILLLIGVIIVNAVLNDYSNKIVRENDIELTPIHREWEYLSNIIDDYAFGKLIRIYDFARMILDKCQKNRDMYQEKQFKMQKINLISRIVLSSLAIIQEGAVYIFLAMLAVRGEITLGEFTMYLAATMAFSDAINNLVGFTIGLNYTSEYINDFVEFIHTPDSMCKEGKDEIEQKDLYFEFKNVFFKYPQTDYYVLKNINVKFHAKEQLALVGENGAGKTTFVKLLMRFYDPTSGEILLNGKNIKEYELSEYFKIFASVFQDYQLFSFTILENIAFQDSEHETEVMNALRKAGVLEKILSLPRNIYTYLGKGFEEDGVELSGGEMQKIAIARAVYKDAETFIMDEPTANLSPIAEYNIFKNFSDSTLNKMVVYISHRLTSTAFSNRILVFKDANIVEDGTHQQLMNENGFYKKMFSLQAAYYLDGEVKIDE